MKKRLYTSLCALLLTFAAQMASAQGWPANYGGVMLQGFSWDSYTDTQWSTLESQADELSRYFKLIWVPQSGNCNTSYNNMGYMPVYYFNQNSSFGSEAQLRSMIQAFKQRGTGIVADVVINHRNNLGANGSWVDFPKETYNGVTYQMLPSDIPANDDGGKTKAWADENGYSLSANNDEGGDWSGCRDLDHKSQNVQECVKAYVKYLVDDLGYTGFRYDMVKGYDGSHVADYNQAAGVEYSVGEYWDSNEKIESWINATGKKSAAFDFRFRYNVRDAVNGNDWSKLNSDYNLMHDPAYRQYAVTYIGRQRLHAGHAGHALRLPAPLEGVQAGHQDIDRRTPASGHHQHERLQKRALPQDVPAKRGDGRARQVAGVPGHAKPVGGQGTVGEAGGR